MMRWIDHSQERLVEMSDNALQADIIAELKLT